MTDVVRGRFAAFFGPSITSGRGLIWFFPIGTLLIIITVPRDGRIGLTDVRWWVAAIAAQAALTATILGLARLSSITRGLLSSSSARAGIVLAGGAIRGAVLALVISWLALPQAPQASVFLRCANSALICCLWLGFIGLLIQAGRDYRAQYRTLLARAVALHRAEIDTTVDVENETLAAWSGVQQTMREASKQLRLQLGNDDDAPSGADLAAAAAVVSQAVSQQVRPTSHGLWFTQSEAPPRLRAGALIWDCLSDWRLPMRDIALILCAVAFVGSIIRAGLVTGIGFATLYVVISLALLWLSNLLARRIPGPAVGITTILLLPWILLALAIWIGQGILHVTADNGGAAVAAGATSIVAFGVLLLSRVAGERRELLQALQARIDESAVILLARREARRDSERELGVFLHHSIQSELSALALQLGEAATSSDANHRSAARSDALDRILRIQEAAPPWSASPGGLERIAEIITSWEGIARIDVSLPASAAGGSRQWKLVAQAIEESIANAVRGGRADHITVTVRSEGDSLTLEVCDNGTVAMPDDVHLSGLGTAWLHSVAPGQWSRERVPGGSVLRAYFG